MTIHPLHSEIIQEIFRQLYMRYGADWSRHWSGIDVGEMSRAWSQELAGLQRHEVEHALQNLPAYPPNAPTFRRIAREAPRPDRFFTALPRPHSAMPEHVRAKLRALADQLREDAVSIMAMRSTDEAHAPTANETREQAIRRRTRHQTGATMRERWRGAVAVAPATQNAAGEHLEAF